MLRKYDMTILQIFPLQLSDVGLATIPWEIQKRHFQHYYSYASDYLRYIRKKQNSNCCTVALAVNVVYCFLLSALP